MDEELIERLLEELEGIQYNTADEVLYDGKIETEYPEEIYHYTSFESAVKIIESGKIWFGDVRYMNDITELREGNQILHSVSEEYPELLCGASGLVSSSMQFSKNSELMHDASCFAACFSKAGDDLRQWQSYGSQGSGVALKFNTKNILGEAKPIFKELHYFGLVCYAKPEKKAEYVRALFAQITRKFNDYGITLNSIPRPIFNALCVGFLRDIVLCKTHHYQDEKEIRFFTYQLDGKPGYSKVFLSQNGLLKPYVEMLVEKEKLSGIVLGPCVKSDANVYAFKHLLRQNNYSDDCKVTKSELEYRV